MITGRQIRAARGLLKWRVEDLAQHTGLSREALSRMEDDAVKPRDASLSKILKAFDEQGVEFIGSTGVQWAQHQVRTLAGVDGLKIFFDDVRAVFRENPAQPITISGFDEDYFEDRLGEYLTFHRNKMTEYGNVRMQCLIEEGDQNLGASDYCEYKWMPKENFSSVPFYVYGDRTAIIVASAPENPLIFIIKNKSIAEAYRKQFAAMWSFAKTPFSK